MKKTLLLGTAFLLLCGFSWGDTARSIVTYIRTPIDIAVDAGVKAMHSGVATTASLYDKVTVR